MRHTTRVIGAVLGLMTWATCADAQVVQSAERNPLAPALQQVEARFVRIQREVDRLRAAGQAADADAMARQLQHFKDQLAGTAPSQVVGPELNIVGMYDPARSAIVNVNPSDRPGILALTSYHTVNWDVRLAEGANLQKVIVSSYDPSRRPTNLPEHIPVELYSYPSRPPWLYAYRRDLRAFPHTARALKTLTGQTPTTFQGQYRYAGMPFTIGAGGETWTAERVLSDMHTLYEQATAFDLAADRRASEAYHFKAIHHTYDQTGRRLYGAVSDFTPVGPISGTFRGIPANIRQVAFDPNTSTYYGTTPHMLVRLDPRTGEERPFGGIEWLTGVAYDTTRNRLVASNLSGEGFFYVFRPNGTLASQVSLNNVDLYSLTYSAADDAFYALSRGTADRPLILKYDASFRPAGRINLSDYIPYESDLWDYQLTATGDRLSLITPAVPDLYRPHLPPQAMSYLINPATGAVTYLGAIPEPGAGALLAATLGGALLRRRR